ncbi:MAG: cytochrome c3 family protein [Acidobacteriota bacterium]|nr:cytochrome c3 family protein [Acidobacteriota bacterium]
MNSRRVIFGIIALVGVNSWAGIENTVHNLGTSGPGQVKALTEERICIFCHAPHRATTRAPLWNRNDSRASYLLYDSPTLDAQPGQPTGATRMCLSCHDGTVALGDVVSEPSEIAFPAGHRMLDPSTGSLETDLGDDHPVSFLYDDNLAGLDPELKSPAAIDPPVTLDANGEMQCTACHDPHDNSYGNFLVTSNYQAGLCLSCHVKTNWDSSQHATSTAGWNGSPPDPWPESDETSVVANGCRNCHDPHSAAQPRWINQRNEEDTCLACHNMNVASDNTEAEFGQPYRHPVTLTSGVHDPEEDPLTAPRHVECTDCHNPHQVAPPGGVSAPTASGALRGVSGIDVGGNPVDPVNFEYEVCFKCHGDGTNAGETVPRTAGEVNTRLEFATDAISFHPITQAGRNPSVPSLVQNLDENSVIYCRSCHSSNLTDGQSFDGGGPHGSQYRFLLRKNYEIADFTQESATAYELCYMCHVRSVILGKKTSGFKEHRKHIVGEDSPCSACHDPHGIAASRGTTTGNSHLISFDTTIVFPNKKGELRFEDRGYRRGSCFLSCHGEDHDDKNY